MSAEIIVTIAVGGPTAIIAVLAYLSNRTKDEDERFRKRVGDLIAPLTERMSNVEEDIREMKQK